MEPMFEFVTALVDVAMHIPETKIDEYCAEDTGENKCDYEVSRHHDLGLPISRRAKSQPTPSQQGERRR